MGINSRNKNWQRQNMSMIEILLSMGLLFCAIVVQQLSLSALSHKAASKIITFNKYQDQQSSSLILHFSPSLAQETYILSMSLYTLQIFSLNSLAFVQVKLQSFCTQKDSQHIIKDGSQIHHTHMWNVEYSHGGIRSSIVTKNSLRSDLSCFRKEFLLLKI